MKRIRVLALGGVAVITIAGMSAAAASVGASAPITTRAQVVSQLQTLEHRVAANPKALAAVQRAEVAMQAQQRSSHNGQPSSPPPPCPSAAPNAGNPQPCGVVGGNGGGNGGGGGGNNGGNPPPCPSSAPNAGHPQPCGIPLPTATASPSGSPTGGGAACGAKDAGGTAAAGPISGPLYGIGVQVSDGGGAPIGDLVQEVACAVYTNLGL